MRPLSELDKTLKSLIIGFVAALTFGVAVGLVYLIKTNQFSPMETQVNLALIYSHAITFSLIFLILGFLFYHTSLLSDRVKQFLLIEPFAAVILSYGSMWAMHAWHPGFMYLMILSIVLMYLSYCVLAGGIVWESFQSLGGGTYTPGRGKPKPQTTTRRTSTGRTQGTSRSTSQGGNRTQGRKPRPPSNRPPRSGNRSGGNRPPPNRGRPRRRGPGDGGPNGPQGGGGPGGPGGGPEG